MTRVSLHKDKIKILLLEGLHPSSVEVLEAAGYSL
ncbi:phosphoglycerate dehydrogenase, partial [Vibrio sp. 10N.222.49.C9]